MMGLLLNPCNPCCTACPQRHIWKYDASGSFQWSAVSCCGPCNIVTTDSNGNVFTASEWDVTSDLYDGGPKYCVTKHTPTGRQTGEQIRSNLAVLHLFVDSEDKIYVNYGTSSVYSGRGLHQYDNDLNLIRDIQPEIEAFRLAWGLSAGYMWSILGVSFGRLENGWIAAVHTGVTDVGATFYFIWTFPNTFTYPVYSSHYEWLQNGNFYAMATDGTSIFHAMHQTSGLLANSGYAQGPRLDLDPSFFNTLDSWISLWPYYVPRTYDEAATDGGGQNYLRGINRTIFPPQNTRIIRAYDTHFATQLWEIVPAGNLWWNNIAGSSSGVAAARYESTDEVGDTELYDASGSLTWRAPRGGRCCAVDVNDNVIGGGALGPISGY